VRQAEIEEATAAVAVPSFERQVVQVENALSVLLGRNPGPIPRGLALVEQTLPDDPPAGLPALRQRLPSRASGRTSIRPFRDPRCRAQSTA